MMDRRISSQIGHVKTAGALKGFFRAPAGDQRAKLNQLTFTKSAGWPLVKVR
jgi:hypothetical protein